MSSDAPVVIDGHKVDPHRVDEFYDGKTGRRVTDEEWDESARRKAAAEADAGEFD